MTVITVSRQFGSGGEKIVDQVCQILGYHQFGKTEIIRAAIEAGLSVTESIDYSEDNYKVKNFLDRLFKRTTTVAQVHVWREDANGKRSVEEINIDEEGALALVQKAVRMAYQEGDVVILGRGGQVLLKGLPNTLHVRIEADLEDRIQAVRNQLKHDQTGFGPQENVEFRREAQDLITRHDQASSGYIKQFYGCDWADPHLYDLIINTSQVNIEDAVHAIIEKIRLPQPVG